MRVELYKDSCEDRVVTIGLVRKCGNIVLGVVDDGGNIVSSGNLISFYPDGRVKLHTSVADFGFKRDRRGSIVFED